MVSGEDREKKATAAVGDPPMREQERCHAAEGAHDELASSKVTVEKWNVRPSSVWTAECQLSVIEEEERRRTEEGKNLEWTGERVRHRRHMAERKSCHVASLASVKDDHSG